jgi:uncharacterized membrane protein YkvA (DUF1232 family)
LSLFLNAFFVIFPAGKTIHLAAKSKARMYMSEDDIQWREINYDTPGSEQKHRKSNMTTVDANLWEQVEKVGNKISFARDIRALYKYMSDPYVSWYRKTIVAAAIVYFVSPIDEVEDLEPLIRNLNDLGVISALLKYLGSELVPYYD